jgi:anaerobic selenocysteine-containing dehydrogenase
MPWRLTIIEEGLGGCREFLAKRVEGFEDYASPDPPTMRQKKWRKHCGVPATDIRAAARLYAQAANRRCVFTALGMTEHTCRAPKA